MKWLEVIKVRSMGSVSGLSEELFRSMDKFSQNGLIEIKTFRHATLETDMSMHLLWESERPEQEGSALGLRLAQALKEFGLIDHSIWVEEESCVYRIG